MGVVMTEPAENVFRINKEELPGAAQADSRGELLLYSPKVGWMIVNHVDIKETMEAVRCTHWTFLPEDPWTV